MGRTSPADVSHPSRLCRIQKPMSNDIGFFVGIGRAYVEKRINDFDQNESERLKNPL